MEGTLWLAPFLLVVLVRRLDIEPEWKTIADMTLIGYVFVCLIALIAGARG